MPRRPATTRQTEQRVAPTQRHLQPLVESFLGNKNFGVSAAHEHVGISRAPRRPFKCSKRVPALASLVGDAFPASASAVRYALGPPPHAPS